MLRARSEDSARCHVCTARHPPRVTTPRRQRLPAHQHRCSPFTFGGPRQSTSPRVATACAIKVLPRISVGGRGGRRGYIPAFPPSPAPASFPSPLQRAAASPTILGAKRRRWAWQWLQAIAVVEVGVVIGDDPSQMAASRSNLVNDGGGASDVARVSFANITPAPSRPMRGGADQGVTIVDGAGGRRTVLAEPTVLSLYPPLREGKEETVAKK